MIKLGSKVKWESMANGKTKSRTGVVVEVVLAGNRPDPKLIPMFRKGKQLGTRMHESYVVQCGKEYLWPVVSRLQLVGGKVSKPTSSPVAKKPVSKTPPVKKKVTTVVEETKADGTVVTTTTTTVEVAKLENDFVICLDSSGSMESSRDGAIKAFNEEVETIKGEAHKLGMKMPKVTLFTFGKQSSVKLEYFRIPADQFLPLSRGTFVPDGQTPMFDCIGDAIEKLLAEPDVRSNENLSVVLHVITDGAENHSKRFDANSIARLFEQTKATGRWSHAIMVPRGSKSSFVNRFGAIDSESVMEWETTNRGAEQAGAVMRGSVVNYMTGRSTGSKSAPKFFVQPDLSKLTAADLAKLTDLSKHFKCYTVDQEAAIKDYIEGKTGKPYVIGSAYYQLSKAEKKVHKHKAILLRDRFTKKIFGGAQARQLIGLPHDVDAKVEPGNHANFDIFVESTSVNRKLVRGSLLLHDHTQVMDKTPTWQHYLYSSNGAQSNT